MSRLSFEQYDMRTLGDCYELVETIRQLDRPVAVLRVNSRNFKWAGINSTRFRRWMEDGHHELIGVYNPEVTPEQIFEDMRS